MEDVIVIGAGFGGLSTACLLANDGYDVTILEKNWDVGGRAMMFEKDGYKFNMGPSWYLMPDAFDTFFEAMGTSTEEELDLERLDPSYRIFFGQDDYVDIRSDLEKNLELFEELEPGVTDTFLDYLEKAQEKYEISMEEVLYKDYQRYTDFFTLRLLREGPKLDILTNMDSLLKNTFESEKLRKILAYTMVFLGNHPKKTPGVYSLMSHADYNLGVFYPDNGMNGVAKAMADLARRNGVSIELETEVDEVLVKEGDVRGVRTVDGDVWKSDKVVVNADYEFAEMNFLDDEHRTYDESYWESRTMAPSALLLYLGVDKKVEKLDHHNLFFHDDWENHFEKVFDDPSWPEDFHLYVCCPSKTNPDVAPDGKENIFALLPLSPGLEDDEEKVEEYGEKMIEVIEDISDTELKEAIEVKETFSHSDFKNTFNAYKGTALGLAHTMMQTAVFRPSHRSQNVEDLYYVGHYTHPGIGVPMTVIGGHIIRDIVREEDGL